MLVTWWLRAGGQRFRLSRWCGTSSEAGELVPCTGGQEALIGKAVDATTVCEPKVLTLPKNLETLASLLHKPSTKHVLS